jgi:hypothetical protein
VVRIEFVGLLHPPQGVLILAGSGGINAEAKRSFSHPASPSGGGADEPHQFARERAAFSSTRADSARSPVPSADEIVPRLQRDRVPP